MAFLFKTFSKITAACKIMINDANPAFHSHISFQEKFIPLPWKEISSILLESILQDHLVNDLSAKDASPSEKFFGHPIEFFEDHDPAATMAFHNK